MVALPRAEYDRMMEAQEDQADARAAGRAEARLSSGEDKLFPFEMVKKIEAGISPLKIWREYRRLTQAMLAEKCGIAQAAISKIEKRRSIRSVDALKSLAMALDVQVDNLIPPSDIRIQAVDS